MNKARGLSRGLQRSNAGWITVVAVVVLVAAGLVGYAIYHLTQSDDPTIDPSTAPAHATERGDGLVDGDGPVTVDIWLDAHCPACTRFEMEAGPTLDQLVDDGTITRVFHPISFLDRASTDQYSTRAAASIACAADGDAHPEYIYQLLALQPPQGGPGLTSDQLIEVGRAAGLDEQSFGQCVRDGEYRDWVNQVTRQAGRDRVNATPTVRVNGEEVAPSAGAVVDAIQAAQPNG